MSRHLSLAPLDDQEIIRTYNPGEADPWLEYQRKQLVRQMGPLPQSDLDAEVDAIIASAPQTLTASTDPFNDSKVRTLSLRSNSGRVDRRNGVRGVVLSTVIEQRRSELAERMTAMTASTAPAHSNGEWEACDAELARARARRRSLTAAAKAEAMPKVTPEQALANRVAALAVEVERADAADPTSDKTTINASLLEGARAVVAAYGATKAGA